MYIYLSFYTVYDVSAGVLQGTRPWTIQRLHQLHGQLDAHVPAQGDQRSALRIGLLVHHGC